MLGKKKIVAFVPIKDAVKAKKFYRDVLGLRFVDDDKFALVFDANGVMLRAARVPDFKPAQFTIVGEIPSGQSMAVSIAAGDLNLDGNLDLAMTLSSSVVILTGAGDGTFQQATFPISSAASSLISGRSDIPRLSSISAK